jgi:RNA polymerase sigma-70 factor, ECF subfamily
MNIDVNAPPQAVSDAELVRAATRGETSCYGELVERYKRMLYGIAWSRTGNADLSEDVVQDAFLQGYRYLGALRHPEKFPAWLARITRNLSSRAVRNARREQVELHRWALEQPSAVPARTAQQPGVADTLQTAMEDLSESHREALVLFYMQGKSVRAAATALDISETAYKTRLHRARQALKGLLEQRLEEALGSMEAPSDTRSRVMAGIVALPVSSGLTGAGAAGLLLKFVPFLLNLAFVWGWIGYVFRGVSSNYRSGAAVRRKVLWHNYVVVAVTVSSAVAVTMLFSHRFGFMALYGLLGAYMGAAAILSLWQVRITPHPLIRANAMAFPVITGVFLLICVGWLPPLSFVAGFLFLNILLWRARKDQPMRQDYNLFLRATMGTLCDAGGDRAATPVSREEVLRFATMLGSRFLVIDRVWHDDVLRIYTGFVRVPPMQVLLPLPARLCGASYIDILPDGSCAAQLEARDRVSLQKLAAGDFEPRQLEKQVATAVEASMAEYLRGNHEGALRCVEAVSDEQVFAVAPHRLKSMRIMYIVSIASGVLLLAVLALQYLLD